MMIMVTIMTMTVIKVVMMIMMTKTMMIVAEVVMVMIIENFDRQEL